MHLPNPWVALVPGLIVIADAQASNLYAHQHFLLWKDADSKFRSELNLRYTDSFPLIYATAGSGSELVLAAANAEARLDRPVDVKGTPLPVHTLDSLMLLVYTDAQQSVFFYEDNILTDSLDSEGDLARRAGRGDLAGDPECAVHDHAGQQPAPVRDTARRRDGRTRRAAAGHGSVRTAADAARSVRRQRDLAAPPEPHGPEKAAGDPAAGGLGGLDQGSSGRDPDTVTTSFAFAPLGTQQKTIAAWSSAALQQRRATLYQP